MSAAKKRVAILISGRGSNMQSLVRAMRTPGFPAEPVVVVSNRPEAEGLVWAKEHGIPAVAIDHKEYANRMAFEARLHQALLDHGTELICNAGFMRLLTGGFVDRWKDRQLNIHPSLLPAFPGLDTHERVLDSGALITGCTVHFVRLEMDSGPIIAQSAVAVLPGDTATTLSQRVLAVEHKLYPLALRLVASDQVRIVNETAQFSARISEPAPLMVPFLEIGV
ncbi:MAG: phosphoribosylglycinamide formyltransferase [Hyphomicrobiaceae bacterium]